MTNKLVGSENLPDDYLKSVIENTAPSALITVNIACQKPLVKHPGLALYANSRRLSYAANMSAPELKHAPAAGQAGSFCRCVTSK